MENKNELYSLRAFFKCALGATWTTDAIAVETTRADNIGTIDVYVDIRYRTQCGWNGTGQLCITIQRQVSELRQ